MFVCHGNICRSPMAEFIFKDLAKKQGAADRFLVASSATSTEEIRNGIGNPVYRYHKVGSFLPPEQEAEEWMYLKQL